MTPEEIANAAVTVMSQAATPAGVALIVGMVATQGAKMLTDKYLRTKNEEPGLHDRETRLLSFFLTAFLAFPVACWFMRIPWRGPNFGLGVAAGIAAPFVVWAVKRYFGSDKNGDAKPPAPPPLDGAPAVG